MGKEDVVYIYTHTHTMNYLSVIRKNEIMSFAVTWMHLAMIILSEVTQEDKYYMISLTCEIYNMTQMKPHPRGSSRISS